MEKSRRNKKIVLIVLLLIVVGLSIGFAAFTATLKIQSSASVMGDQNTFKVVFSESDSEVTGSKTNVSGVASAGTFNGTELSGLTATFTQPGQTATWEVYAFNAGQFDAFLKSVTFENAAGSTATIKGVAGEGTTQTYVDEAIKGMSIQVDVRGEAYTTTRTGITNHKLTQSTGEKITVTLSYDSTAAIADGDFTVNIGDILLGYESVD
jgi:hypothetical protein